MAAEQDIISTSDETAQVTETMRQVLKNGFDARHIYAMLIRAVIPEHCKCSRANFAPNQLGTAFATGQLKELETISGIAGCFAVCAGMSGETVVISPEKIDEETGVVTPQREITVDMCHYPPAKR